MSNKSLFEMPSTSLFRRNIDRDPPTLRENVAVEQNLFQRFVDEGDMLLGRALQTPKGRELYDNIKKGVELLDIDFIDLLYDATYDALMDWTERDLFASDDVKIITYMMMEKAVTDCLRRKLLSID